MKTILFPTDFLNRFDEALQQVVGLAKKIQAKVIIYHVYHHPFAHSASTRHAKSLLRSYENSVDLKFKELLDNMEDLKSIDHEFKRELGLTVEKIIEISKKEKIDMICMRTKGAEGFGELWGTKTAQIVKSVDMPVLVIPEGSKLETIQKVALVCDYSNKTDYHALDFLLDILNKLKLSVDIITLNRDERTMTTRDKAYRHLVRQKLESASPGFHFALNNDTRHGIIEYSKKNNIDLLAILPKKYNFLVQLFHESLTRKLTFQSHIPLLVLK